MILNIFPFAVMFLSFPVIIQFGFDYLFISIGIGIYFGLISECEEIGIENTELFSIIIFSFFGASLSVKDAFLLGISGWSLVIFLTLILIFVRFITVKFFMRVFSSEKVVSLVFCHAITLHYSGKPVTASEAEQSLSAVVLTSGEWGRPSLW